MAKKTTVMCDRVFDQAVRELNQEMEKCILGKLTRPRCQNHSDAVKAGHVDCEWCGYRGPGRCPGLVRSAETIGAVVYACGHLAGHNGPCDPTPHPVPRMVVCAIDPPKPKPPAPRPGQTWRDPSGEEGRIYDVLGAWTFGEPGVVKAPRGWEPRRVWVERGEALACA
jgi:hypothetical protein